jgi:S1-C subfamily serine protease
MIGWLLAVGGFIGLPALLDPGAAGAEMGPMMSTSPEEIQEVILRVKPSVVLISVKVQGEATVSCGEKSTKTVSLPSRGGTGTGFVVHPDGYIATNAHVVGPARGALSSQELKGLAHEAVVAACGEHLTGLRLPTREARIKALIERPENRRGLRVARLVQVAFQDGKTLEATVLASNPPVLQAQPETGSARGVPDDVAILKVERRDLVAARLGQVPAQIGDQLFVIGFPGVVLTHEMLSTRSRVAPSVTLGRVSGFKLDLADQEVIQTDAAITWGNSGGPAFNTRGDVIGVATFLSVGREGTEVQGFNFLIPVGRVAALAATVGLVPTGDTALGRQWAAAVSAFFGERYDAAIADLREILRADPTFPDARRLLAATQARPARGSAEWGRWMHEMMQEGEMSSPQKGSPGGPVEPSPSRGK